MRAALLCALLLACGRDEVRSVVLSEPDPGPSRGPPPRGPPPPMSDAEICTGAEAVVDYDVPKTLCPTKTMRVCQCNGHEFFAFCLGDHYYYEFLHEEWEYVCPRK